MQYMQNQWEANKKQKDRSVIKLIDCEGLRNEYFLLYVYRTVYLSGFPREKEPIGYICVCIYMKGDSWKEVAHMITEGRKSNNMPSASWESGKPVVSMI